MPDFRPIFFQNPAPAHSVQVNIDLSVQLNTSCHLDLTEAASEIKHTLHCILPIKYNVFFSQISALNH